MTVTLIKYPTEQDWELAKACALATIGKEAKTPPTMEWKRDILNARHSPIRELHFVFYLEDIPSWVATHLVRHVHCQPYVRSQRNDRQDNYDRTKAPQDAPVSMMWSMNAEALMQVCNKRLCNMASVETKRTVQAMCREVLKVCPEFKGFLVPMCAYHGGVCREFKGGCGKMPHFAPTSETGMEGQLTLPNNIPNQIKFYPMVKGIKTD